MAIAYSFGSQANGFATSIEVTPPAHNAGDLLVLFGYRGNDGDLTTSEGGWTDLAIVTSSAGADSTGVVSYGVASAGTPGTLTLSTTGVAAAMRGVCMKVTGFDSGTPIAGTAGTDKNVIDDDTPDAPAMTGGASGDRVFTFIAGQQFDADAIVQPSGYTLDFDNEEASRVAVASITASGANTDPGEWTSAGTGADPGMVTFGITLDASGGIAPIAHYYRHIL